MPLPNPRAMMLHAELRTLHMAECPSGLRDRFAKPIFTSSNLVSASNFLKKVAIRLPFLFGETRFEPKGSTAGRASRCLSHFAEEQSASCRSRAEREQSRLRLQFLKKGSHAATFFIW